MSAIDFYLEHGFTPMVKTTSLSGPGTLVVWSPVAGKRVHVTDVSIAANVKGTIAFYFDNGNDKIAQFTSLASATIAPDIGLWQSTVMSGKIFARASAGAASDGWDINLTGVEI